MDLVLNWIAKVEGDHGMHVSMVWRVAEDELEGKGTCLIMAGKMAWWY